MDAATQNPTPITPDLELVRELHELGGESFKRCSQCATCAIVCHLGEGEYPRQTMLHAQWGLRERLEGSLHPWLCYYCGECSARCPREAEPGETMMTLRRWLTTRYDFTGIARLFYRSWKAELAVLVTVALATAGAFLAYGFARGDLAQYDGPSAFLPSAVVHRFDWAMAGVLVLLLGVNSARMWWFTTGRKGLRVPLGAYLKQLYLVPLHFLTQPRFATCENRGPYRLHLVLMLSYLTLLTLIMFFLHEMQAGPEIRWAVHGFGYAATIGLLVGVIYAIRGRLARATQLHRHSHESDWLFLVMLVLVAGTGIAQHVLHRVGAMTAANVAYVVHLALVVPMLVLEVPFGKWSHMLYRPLAVYLDGVQRAARAQEQPAASPIAEPQQPAA